MYFTNALKGTTQILHHAQSNTPLRTVTSVANSALGVTLVAALNRLEGATGSEHDLAEVSQLSGAVPAAVAAALGAELDRYAPGTVRTWTFCGHWDGGLVIDFVVPGEVNDDRDDTGQWPQGLWAAAGSGVTIAKAQAYAVVEYEDDSCGECSVCHATKVALPAGETAGVMHPCWNCQAD